MEQTQRPLLRRRMNVADTGGAQTVVDSSDLAAAAQQLVGAQNDEPTAQTAEPVRRRRVVEDDEEAMDVAEDGAATQEETVGADVASSGELRQLRRRAVDSTAASTQIANPIDFFLAALAEGQSMVFTRLAGSSSFSVRIAEDVTPVVVKRRKTDGDFWQEMHHPSWWGFIGHWQNLSPEEKVKYAIDRKIPWDKHDDPRINLMNLNEAVKVHEGVTKWKPQYSQSKVRRDCIQMYEMGKSVEDIRKKYPAP